MPGPEIRRHLSLEGLHLRAEDETLLLAHLVNDLQNVGFDLLVLEFQIQEGNSHRGGL
jgi:hypothetical protein